MKYEFDNMTTEDFREDVKKDFEEYSDQGLYIKRTPFTVELENKKIELYTYIEDLDMGEYGEDTGHYISIGVIPSYNSLSEDNKKRILDQYMPEDQKAMLEDPICLLFDNFLYGFHVMLHNEQVPFNEDEDKMLNEVEYKVNSAMAVHNAVEGLIGFDLDKYVNRIGNTGWDFLEDFCSDKDLITTALARFEK